MSVDLPEAYDLLRRARPAMKAALVPVGFALGRALAQDVPLPMAVPPVPVSAMDGVALRARSAPAALLRVGSSTPAAAFSQTVGEGECVEVLTGAALPPGTDAVIPLERLGAMNGTVEVPPARPGEHVVPAGAAYPAGTTIRSGTRLGPATVESLASAGIRNVKVWMPPSVRVVPVGDELVSGAVRDTLAPTLSAWLRSIGVSAAAAAPVADDVVALERAFAGKEEIIITTGGTGPSRLDVVRSASAQPIFDSVRVKPGKPTKAFRLPGGRLWIALPGNPTAALLVFAALVRPLFRDRPQVTAPLRGPLQACLTAHADRWRIAPVVLEGDGIVPLPSGPSVATGWWMGADGIVLVEPGADVAAGTTVEVWPW